MSIWNFDKSALSTDRNAQYHSVTLGSMQASHSAFCFIINKLEEPCCASLKMTHLVHDWGGARPTCLGRCRRSSSRDGVGQPSMQLRQVGLCWVSLTQLSATLHEGVSPSLLLGNETRVIHSRQHLSKCLLFGKAICKAWGLAAAMRAGSDSQSSRDEVLSVGKIE